MTIRSHLSRITGAAAGRWEEGALIPLALLALLSPPLPGPWQLRHSVWLAGLLFIAAAVLLKNRRREEPDSLSLAAFLVCLLLLLNAVISLSGGLLSPYRAGYFVVLTLFAYNFGRLWQQGAALAAVVLLETGQHLAAGSLDQAPPGYPPGGSTTALQLILVEALFLALFALALHVLFLRRQRRLRESLAGHVRLREEAESLRTLDGLRSEPGLDAHSPRGRMVRRLSAVEKRDRDLKRLLTLARRALGARQVIYFRSDGDALKLYGSSGDDDRPKTATSIRVGEGIVGGAAKLQQSVLITSFDKGRHPLSYLPEGSAVGSLMVVPLREQEVLRGVLVADHGEKERFTRTELEVFEGFSLEVNLLIEHMHESTMRDRRFMTMEALCAVSDILSRTLKPQEMIDSLVERIGDVFTFDQCAVFIVDLERRRVVLRAQRGFRFKPGKEISFPLGKGLVGYVIAHDQPLIFSDRKKMEIVPGYTGEEKMRSFMGHPLRFRDDRAGAIIFASSRKGNFTTSNLETLKLLANQAGAQISNAFLHKQVEKMARTDGLTGLFNHRHFQEQLDHELVRAGRHENPLSLLLLDIDHFKKLNDTYGHPFGDVVLKGVSQALARIARSIDFVARYGGEEFTIILASTDRKGCRNMAERVLMTVSALRFTHEEKGEEISVTVSVGSSTYPEDGTAKDEVIGRADQALYLAKESGRNCHRSYRDVLGT